ncbi:MAG: SsrA-binding protein SmpB [Endomicrobium sp.]|jgi:SsrA-binding protein|nr:SsrA-binding protein SmpB [Endomicrobium sp.]
MKINSEGRRVFSSNKKAYYDYEILEKLEVGVILSGYEVKSVRRSSMSLVDGVVGFYKGEAFVDGVFIAPYEQISTHVVDYDARRKRKLLMHRAEINKLCARVKEKGLTVVPLEAYISRGNVKLLVGLAKGKKSYDKREYIKNKDIAREMAKDISNYADKH